MKLGLFQRLAAIVCAAAAGGCSVQPAGRGGVRTGEASLASLEEGASLARAYLGTTQLVAIDRRPVVSTFDLLGGAEVEIEIATRDGKPVRFELWQQHVDGWANLATTVDSRSGFALEALHATEDSSWLLRLLPDAPEQVVVRIDCTGSTRGCTPFLQPGDRCPAGWQCDQGLTCVVPGDTCQLTSALESRPGE